MYVHVCHYVQVLHVCAGIACMCWYVTMCRNCMYVYVGHSIIVSLSAGIECMHRYCMYLQVLHVCAGIACMCRRWMYVQVCHYVQVLHVCSGIYG
jgi:hypothetical protein